MSAMFFQIFFFWLGFNFETETVDHLDSIEEEIVLRKILIFCFFFSNGACMQLIFPCGIFLVGNKTGTRGNLIEAASFLEM